MNSIAGIICLSLAFFVKFHPASAAGNCSEGYLKQLGMKMDDEETTKGRVFLTSGLMAETGKRLLPKIGAKPEHYKDVLLKKLTEKGLFFGEDKCVECFSESVRCTVKHCKGVCMHDPCSKGCQNCIGKNCKKALVECVGQDDLVNPCAWAKEYEAYRKQGEKASEGEGASGTS